jgi:hypothetical protein
LAVPGTKPKPDGQKRNRVKPTFEWTEVPNRPFRGAPRLPARQANGMAWPARTKKWWSAISRMPHCVLWAETDWEYAVDTAQVHAQFSAGDMRMAAELRNREKLLGNTFDARRDLRIRYVDPNRPEEPAGVTSLDDYRAALG